MAANYGLTSQGLRIKRIDEVVFELGVAFRSDFGEEANIDPETSVLGQIIGVYSERDALLWELALAVYQAGFPDSAEQVSLDNVAAITAIERLAATRSTVTARCSGTIGVLLTAGRIVSVTGTGARFQLIADATIGGSGFVDADFEAVELGEVQAPAGSLTVIETPVSGWTSVLNEEDADLGSSVESDVELRLRRRDSLRVIGAATVDAIRARLIDEVDGVTDAIVFENDTDVTDGGGRPPHSIHCIVAGGADVDIAEKIFETKSGGIATFGTDIIEVVLDSQGFPHTINADRATILRTFLHIQIEVSAGFNVGSKKKEKVTVATNVPSETITLSVNGRDFPVTAGATKAITAQLLSDAVQAGGADWVPVTASQTTPGTDEFLFLESDYEGNDFVTAWSASGTSALAITNEVLNAGDQGQIIADVIEFAEGSTELPQEQTIGADLFRARYFGPVNLTALIETISITTTEGTEDSDYWPTTAPPGGGDWAASDIVVDADEQADLDTLRVTVEII
jgi:uncharacterized phage protein gp47/JayE